MMTEIIKCMTKKIIISFIILMVYCFPSAANAQERLWKYQIIDTMKTSRDQTLYKMNDKKYDADIRKELKQIKALGATHVAIDGAYDNKYLPWLKRWVRIAREEQLSVWFRGNFSGWHGWFTPKNMTREQHKKAVENLILENPELFENGDSFTACPECESGGEGIPVTEDEVKEFREFMLDEYDLINVAFKKINKNVHTNWLSINPDVAKSIYDEETVRRIGNVLTLDYFVKDVSQLQEGLDYFKSRFPNAQILIGEFGAPIPEINGAMSEEQKAKFIEQIFMHLTSRNDIMGINYWVSSASTTELLDSNLERNKSAQIVEDFFKPKLKHVNIKVVNTLNEGVENIKLTDSINKKEYFTDHKGEVTLSILQYKTVLNVDGNKYYKSTSIGLNSGDTDELAVKIYPEKPDIIYKLRYFLMNLTSLKRS